MKKIILIYIVTITIFIEGNNAQTKGQLSVIDQQDLIAFLMKKKEIYDTISNWKKYLDAIRYWQIFASTANPQNNKIFIFCCKSPHASYFILLKQGADRSFLDCNSLNNDMPVLLAFFRKNVVAKDDKILKALFEVNEAYRHNKNNYQKIPTSQ